MSPPSNNNNNNPRRSAQTPPSPPLSQAANKFAKHPKFLSEKIDACKDATALQNLLAETRDEELNALHCAAAFVQLAKFRSRDVDLVERLAGVTQDLGKLRARELAMCCYGIANGGWVRRVPAFLTEQVEQLGSSTDSQTIIPPQSLANTAWAFASLKQRVPAFAAYASKHVLDRVDFEDFTALDLVHLTWALCVLNRAADPIAAQVLGKLLREIGRRRTDKFTTRASINDVLWAASRLEKMDPALYKQITATQWHPDWKKKLAEKMAKKL